MNMYSVDRTGITRFCLHWQVSNRREIQWKIRLNWTETQTTRCEMFAVGTLPHRHRWSLELHKLCLPHLQSHKHHTGWPKKFGTIFCMPSLHQIIIDFRNCFTARIRRKFAIILRLKSHHTSTVLLHYLVKCYWVGQTVAVFHGQHCRQLECVIQ